MEYRKPSCIRRRKSKVSCTGASIWCHRWSRRNPNPPEESSCQTFTDARSQPKLKSRWTHSWGSEWLDAASEAAKQLPTPRTGLGRHPQPQTPGTGHLPPPKPQLLVGFTGWPETVGMHQATSSPSRPAVFPARSRSAKLPCSSNGKESACNAGTWVQSLGREDPWRREWQPTPVFLPGESRGQRSLAGYNPWDCREPDTTECYVPGQQHQSHLETSAHCWL